MWRAYWFIFLMKFICVVEEHVLIWKVLAAEWTFEVLRYEPRQVLTTAGGFLLYLIWLLRPPLVFIGIFRLLVRCTTADEKAHDFVTKRQAVIWFFFLTHANLPVEHAIILFDFFILLRLFHGFAAMLVLKAMWHAQIHRTFRTFEIVDVRYFGLASRHLAVRGSPIFTNFSFSLVQLHLAFARFNVLIPQVRRRYALLSQSLQAQAWFAYRAQNYVVVVLIGAERRSGALVVTWASVICAVDVLAEFTFEREEVLLGAMLKRTFRTDVGEFHFVYLLINLKFIVIIENELFFYY